MSVSAVMVPAAADASNPEPGYESAGQWHGTGEARILRVGSRDVVEDILQEAFVRTLDRVDSIRRTDSAVAWFYRVLRNAIADHYRRQEVRDRTLTQVSAEAGREAPAAVGRPARKNPGNGDCSGGAGWW